MLNVTTAIFQDLLPCDVWNEPFYENGCNHPPESFIGSVKFCDPESMKLGIVVERVIDVYVYESTIGERAVQNACIRYGANTHEYYSPGTVMDLLLTAAIHRHEMKHYSLAAALILTTLKVRFER